jgi:hypothetical protein
VKRHRFDPFSFVFGALFLVVGATFLFGGSGLTAARPVRMWPAATVVVGVTLAAWAVARAIHREPKSTAAEAVAAEDGAIEGAATDAARIHANETSEEQRPA